MRLFSDFFQLLVYRRPGHLDCSVVHVDFIFEFTIFGSVGLRDKQSARVLFLPGVYSATALYRIICISSIR